uniref:ATP synthase subunit 6 n=1 Tax=Thrips major TaxID=670476 RepID=UPI0030E2B15C
MSFDPKTSVLSEMNWIILLLVTTLFFVSMWKKPTRMNMILMKLNEQIGDQFKIALKSNKDSSKGIFVSLFLLILSVNMMGLFPNIFTPTSHISMNLILSLPMWLGFLIFGWLKFTDKMFSHLVPSGTPTPLISFMVLIELISNFIRPLTLSIRLMANMVSGHLLLTLMGNLMDSSSIMMILILTVVQSILTSLELGVAFIQAYVFCMLLTLYSDDSELSDH